MLSDNEIADSNVHIYGTKGLIIIVVVVIVIVIVIIGSRYCLHASDFKTALAVGLLRQTFYF